MSVELVDPKRSFRHPRPALVFDNEDSARNDANGRRACGVVVENMSGRVRRFWSVPLERADQVGVWRRGAHVEMDPCSALGIARPKPFDWAQDPEFAEGEARPPATSPSAPVVGRFT